MVPKQPPKTPHKCRSRSALEDLLETQQGPMILPQRQHVASHAHGLSLSVSIGGSEVSTNESKTCRALRRPVLRRSHNPSRPCSGFRVQHTHE